MMKKSVIIGKRQIVLAVLVVALGAAVYLNWRFAGADGGLDITAAVSSSQANLGDATYVNNPEVSQEAPQELSLIHI